jgi:ubiquilin
MPASAVLAPRLDVPLDGVSSRNLPNLPPNLANLPSLGQAGLHSLQPLWEMMRVQPPGAAGAAGAGGADGAGREPEVRYSTQMSQMYDMGFTDPEANQRALVATGGNLSAAIERIVRGAA